MLPTTYLNTVPKSGSIFVYTFGYSPKEVIEKFEAFIQKFSTVTDAINALLLLDRNVKSNYQFIKASVTYQILAIKTPEDDNVELEQAILKLHKYARDNQYKTVSDAIEKLIMSSPKSDEPVLVDVTNNSKL